MARLACELTTILVVEFAVFLLDIVCDLYDDAFTIELDELPLTAFLYFMLSMKPLECREELLFSLELA